jgi:aryl-alcohol dehydrogenase-like predicted oxidoreductase
LIKLGIGTAQFGMNYGISNTTGEVILTEIKEILSLANIEGINLIDTAAGYGNSEQNLGVAGIEKFKIVTKIPSCPEGVKPSVWVNEQFNKSAKLLNTTNLYGLLLHAPNDLLRKDSIGIVDELLNLKENGKINKIGVSVYNPEDLNIFLNLIPIDLVQLPMNLIDKRFSSQNYLRKLKSLNIEIHVRSAFLQGLLLMPYDQIPSKFKTWDALWIKWHGWLKSNNISALDACISYLKNLNEIDRIIVGVNNVNQLADIIRSYKNYPQCNFPDISSADHKLINPSLWASL